VTKEAADPSGLRSLGAKKIVLVLYHQLLLSKSIVVGLTCGIVV